MTIKTLRKIYIKTPHPFIAGNYINPDMVVDVTQSQDVNRMIELVLKEFGKIDILVNNAGGTPRGKGIPFSESEEKIWDWQIDLNLNSVRNCTRAVINHMIERKDGKIISIASVAGVKGTPGRIEYSTAKASIIGFTKALAKEVAAFGINVNCVSPGPTETDLLFAAPQENRDALLNTIYLKRFGTPSEVASMVVFLASGESDIITGQNFIVDGGRTL